MWTKDAERKQLRKIADLIEETEIGSYIRMSFAGIVEMCEQNIADDAADNMPDSLAYRDKQIAELQKKLCDANAEGGRLLREAENKMLGYKAEAERLTDEIKRLQSDHDVVTKSYMELLRKHGELERDIAGMEKSMADKDMEIIRLKAKLYDMEHKGGN